jgi:hypothetical protein
VTRDSRWFATDFRSTGVISEVNHFHRCEANGGISPFLILSSTSTHTAAVPDPKVEIEHIPPRELVEELPGVDGRVPAQEEQVVQEPVALLHGLAVHP